MINTCGEAGVAACRTGEEKPDQPKLKYTRNYMRFRKLVRWAVASITYGSGVAKLFSRGQSARILVYHSINHDPLNPFSVSPGDFEAQVRLLSQKYNVISLQELVSRIQDGKEMPANAVAITLDDGFQDNYTFAYPILKKYNVPATIFVVVESLESKAAVGSSLSGREPGRYLSWAQVREISQNGISFGSHSLTHPWLTQVPLAQARREIVQSKAQLEQFLGEPVHLFAYPGGRLCDFSQEIKEIVIESGYSGACVGLNGANGPDTDPYLLRRTKIEVDDSMGVFEMALKGALDAFILLDRTRR